MPVFRPCHERGCRERVAEWERRCPKHQRRDTDYQPRHALHPFLDVAREEGEHVLGIARDADADGRTIAALERVIASWEAGRVDPDGEDLYDYLLCIWHIGWHMGQVTKRSPPPLWVSGAAARRSEKRPEIERLLMEEKSNERVRQLTKAPPRTIDRVRAELVAAGRLPARKRKTKASA